MRSNTAPNLLGARGAVPGPRLGPRRGAVGAVGAAARGAADCNDGHRRGLPPDRGRPGPWRRAGHRAGRGDLGYTHLAAYDHVLGGDTDVHGDLGGPYTIHHPFREPLTMFSYLAGCTTNLAFATSILIGPQRQTALLAKQAAELDILCAGRFRLGLGIGWNKVEYDALDVPFGATRPPSWRSRWPCCAALWTHESVTTEGRFHHITAAGMAPLPVQRPIPIWIGAFVPAALRRVGRVADGWFPHVRPRWCAGGGVRRSSAKGADEAGRDLSGFQFEGRLDYAGARPREARPLPRRWRDAGASHLSLITMHAGLGDDRPRTSGRSRRWRRSCLS